MQGRKQHAIEDCILNVGYTCHVQSFIKLFFPTAPLKPTEIRAESPTTNSITLTWNPATYANTYVVSWNLREEEISRGTNGGRESFIIPDLVAGSSYIIKVTARNEFEDTDSDVVTGLTGKCAH